MPENLRTIENLRNDLVVARDVGALVIGSIGRAVSFRDCLGDPNFEFKARSEDPLGSPRKPRDVDVIGDPDSESIGYMDFFMFDETIVKTSNRGWKIHHHTGFEPTKIHWPASWVFEPVEGLTVFDLPCLTVRPATHHLLIEAARKRHYPRIRDILYRRMPDKERALLHTPEAQAVREILFGWELRKAPNMLQ